MEIDFGFVVVQCIGIFTKLKMLTSGPECNATSDWSTSRICDSIFCDIPGIPEDRFSHNEAHISSCQRFALV